jgi:putative tryptophan/tyrosine transport system substrate-binding protein
LDALTPQTAEAFFFSNEAIVINSSQQIIERATGLGMATMAQNLGSVAEGALAGYGLDYRQEGRLAAKYVLRILAGTHPSELPVEVSERHFFGINLKTARALGLTIPPTFLARADEVIE